MFKKLRERISNILRPREQADRKEGFFSRLFNRKKKEEQEDRTKKFAREAVEEWNLKKAEEEKQRRKEEEAEEKAADQKQKEEEKKSGYDTFNERYGYRWSEENYNWFWDTFGGSDVFEYFPSESLTYAYDVALEKEMPNEVFESYVQQTIGEVQGRGLNQYQAVDILMSKVNSYVKAEVKMGGQNG